MRTRLTSRLSLLFMTFAMVLAIPAVALADIVQNNVVTGGNDTITAGGSTVIKYGVDKQNATQEGTGGLQNCNATIATPVKVYITAPAGVTVSGSEVQTDTTGKYLQFTDCANPDLTSGQIKTATFSSSKVGNHAITHSIVESYAGNYTNDANFTLKVNDSCPGGDTSGNLQDGKCTSNTAPVANNDGPYSATEDAQLTVSAANGVLANDTDPDANTTLSAVLVSGPSNAAASGFTLNANGSFSYTPAADFNGQDSFTYKANDGTAGSNVATVTINVASVNDAPSFTKGANETVLEDAGAQTVAGWATNISVGPANESGQTVDFLVSSTNAALFSVAPGVSANGALTYTPADNANGTATVTVKAHDNGGGADTSAAQTFTITVTPVNDAPEVGAITAANNDPVKEGDSKNYSVTATDVDGDTLTYAWTVKSGAATITSGAATDTATVKFLDGPDNVNLQVVVTDGNGGQVTKNLDSNPISVSNAAPTILLSGDATADEGQTKTYSYSVSDPGNDTHTATTACGLNGTKVSGSDTYSAATKQGSFKCSFPDGPATTNVTATVQDSDGASDTDNQSVTVAVANVAPVVTAAANQNASEGTSKSFNLGSFTDPGDDGSWDVSVDWGDTSAPTTFQATAAGSLGSQSHAYADNGTYTVTVKVAEAGGTIYDTKTFQVTVANADPVVGALSVTDPKNGVACLGGNAISLGFSFTDAGSADTHKATINWGDGSANTLVDPATSPVSGQQHTYSGQGSYTITVTVTDDDSGSGSNTKVQSFRYNIGTTLLSPVNADSTSIFKSGSTIPLKINITDCNGTGVSGLSPTIKMLMISSSAATTGEVEAISTQPNDTNGLMRDLGNGVYMYNLASGTLQDSSAKYKANITYNGYTVTSQNYFSLKTK